MENDTQNRITKIEGDLKNLQNTFNKNNFSNLYIYQTPVRFRRSLRYITRVVTVAGAVTVVSGSDYIVVVNKTTGASTTLNLPISFSAGDTYIIKDGKGDAATHKITVTPASGTIDGASTFVMSTNYQSVTLVYNGTEWNKLN